MSKFMCAYTGVPLFDTLMLHFHGPDELSLDYKQRCWCMLLIPKDGEICCQRAYAHPYSRIKNASGHVG